MALPGLTSAPAQTTGILTEPSVALTVPLAPAHLLQTGKPMSVMVFTLRTPASMMSRPCLSRLEPNAADSFVNRRGAATCECVGCRAVGLGGLASEDTKLRHGFLLRTFSIERLVER
jgi:hypothetical protein